MKQEPDLQVMYSKRSDLGLSQNLEPLNPIHININHKIWCFVVAFSPLKLPSLQSPFGPNILTHPDRMSSALWRHCPTVGASGFSKIRAFSELSLLLHVFSFTTWMMVDKTTAFQTFFPNCHGFSTFGLPTSLFFELWNQWGPGHPVPGMKRNKENSEANGPWTGTPKTLGFVVDLWLTYRTSWWV